MEIKINREIRDYQESVFFGLSLRQLIFAILAIGVAVLIYFTTIDILGMEVTGWLCVLGAAPFGAAGFIKYNGMPFEAFIRAWFHSEILMPEHLTFEGENLYYELFKDQIQKGERK
jgi:hypothetical protein